MLFLQVAFVPAVLTGDFSKTGGYSLIVQTGPYLVPLGLALALLGLLWQARASSRRFRRAAAVMAAQQEDARRHREAEVRNSHTADAPRSDVA